MAGPAKDGTCRWALAAAVGAIAALVAVAGWADAAPIAAMRPVQISPTPRAGSVVAYPQLAADRRGDVTAVWQQSWTNGPTVIEASQRLLGSRRWGPAHRISASGVLRNRQPANGESPAIAESPQGAAVAVWEDNGEIAAADRASRSAAWSPPRRISSAGVDPEPPRVTMTGSHSALAIWSGQRPSGVSVVQVARLALPRGHWGAPMTLQRSRRLITGASVAANSRGQTTMAWKRTIRGSPVGSRSVLSDVMVATSGARPERPRIVVLGRETDLPSQVDANTEIAQPQVGVSHNGRALVAWQAGGSGSVRIAIATRSAGAREWRHEPSIGATGSTYPAVAVAATSVTLAWQSSAGAIFACSENTTARDCSRPTRLAPSSRNASGPVMSTTPSGTTLVAWADGSSTIRLVAHTAIGARRWTHLAIPAAHGAATPAVVAAGRNRADVVWVHSGRPHHSVPSMAIDAATASLPSSGGG